MIVLKSAITNMITTPTVIPRFDEAISSALDAFVGVRVGNGRAWPSSLQASCRPRRRMVNAGCGAKSKLRNPRRFLKGALITIPMKIAPSSERCKIACFTVMPAFKAWRNRRSWGSLVTQDGDGRRNTGHVAFGESRPHGQTHIGKVMDPVSEE